MCTRPFDRNIWFSFIYPFFCSQPFGQNLGSSLIYFFYFHTAIRQKYMVPFHFFFLLCTTIRPKIRFLINLLFLFEHDHSTKLGVALSLYFILFLIVPILGMLYSWQILPLYFLCSVCGRTALIFRPPFQSSTTLYFIHYIHESAAVTFRTLYPCLYEVFTGPLRLHIKSCHFPERIEARRQYFYFFI